MIGVLGATEDIDVLDMPENRKNRLKIYCTDDNKIEIYLNGQRVYNDAKTMVYDDQFEPDKGFLVSLEFYANVQMECANEKDI